MSRIPSITVSPLPKKRTDFTDKTGGITFLYQVTVRDVPQMGNMQIPIAGPGKQRCKIVKMHAPCMKRYYLWEVRRIGSHPDNLPDRDTGNANEVYNGGWLTNVSPALLVDGTTRTWSISGVYEYLLHEFEEEQPIARVPVLRMSKLKITPTDFKKGILG